MSSLVAVFGSGNPSVEDDRRARQLGEALGRAGYGVINGGYGGTMSASAAGARAAGARTVGVTCAAFTFRAGPNPHLDEIDEASALTERLERLIQRASAYVVLPGGLGTWIELALVWEHLRRGLIPRRPFVVWETPWRSIVDAMVSEAYVDPGSEWIAWVSDVDSAVAAVRTGSSK